MPVRFDELPFNRRPDLTPYLLHLTKNSKQDDEFSAYDNLVSILKTGEIWGSSSKKGFIKGNRKATCFMDVPFASLKYVLTPEDTDTQAPRYEPYGLVVTKKFAYESGCRPVIYLSNDELAILQIPKDELWRIVRLEVSKKGWISWLHEREWRCAGNFELPSQVHAVLVRNTNDAVKLEREIQDNAADFVCTPKAIVPLTVICQGLLST